MGQKGLIPLHIQRMAAARSAAVKYRPAGSLVNPERWIASAAKRQFQKEINRVAAERRLIVAINADPNNVIVSKLSDILGAQDEKYANLNLDACLMLDNETGDAQYEYSYIWGINGSIKLRDKVGYLHYVTVGIRDVGEVEMLLWPGTRVAWRVRKGENDAVV